MSKAKVQVLAWYALGLAAAAFSLMFLPRPAHCQTQNGNIFGIVKDVSGGVIPAVNLKLVDPATGLQRSTLSAPDGNYRFALVPKGTYTITAEKIGFRTFVDAAVGLETNQDLRVDISLGVGQSTQRVTVAAQESPITTDTGSISTEVPELYLEHRPDTAYNPGHLAASSTVSATEAPFSFYGSRDQQATISMDGAAFGYWDNYVLDYAISEVTAQTLDAPAKYQTQVTVDAVTRGGTDQLHGQAQFSIYNNYFQAQNPRTHNPNCSTDRPCTGYWTAGFEAAGPLYIPKIYDGRDKTFWMFTYTPQKNFASSSPTTNIVPNANEKAGNLSSLNTALTNPFTGQPFSGNMIPSGMISPVSQKLLQLYAAPDAPGGNTATVLNTVTNNIWYTYAGRADQKLTGKDWLNFSFTRYIQKYDANFGDRSVAGYMGIADGTWAAGTYSVGETRTFSPSIVNESRFSLNWEGPAGYTANGEDVRARMQSLGLTGIPAVQSTLPVTGPDITFPGFTPFLGWESDYNHERFYQGTDNISISHGTHTIQAGFDIKLDLTNTKRVSPSLFPSYDFDGRFTGNGFADFLLGLPGTIALSDEPPITEGRRRELGFFVQDSWRVTPRLTANLGVRYDHMYPEWVANNFQYNFDPKNGQLVVPAGAVPFLDPHWDTTLRPVITASQAGYPTHLMNADGKNLFPRISFAYRPFKDNKTVIRSGYGIYVVPDAMTGEYGNTLLQSGGPFALSTVFNNSLANNQPLLQWPVGYPAAGGQAGGIPNVAGVNPNFRYPYTQQWNFTIEREVFGQGLRVSYVGSKDTKLGYQRNINLPQASSIPFTQSRLLWPDYNAITYTDNGGTGIYNGFETVLTLRRFFGITGQIGYSWAKEMTDISNNIFEGVAGNSIPDPYCLKACNWGPSELVPTNRFYAQYTWDLPYGKGKRFGTNVPRWANAIVGNWEVSQSLKARTGLGFTPIYSGYDPANVNQFTGYPDLVGNPNSGPHTPDEWYNVAAFALPPSGRYGNSGRNVVFGPSIFFANTGLFKTFPLHERYKLVFSATSNNTFNNVNYSLGRAGGAFAGGISTPPINSPNAGYLSSLYEDWSTRQVSSMRDIYFNVALEF